MKAYFEGTALPLEQVNDPMFADKIMGDGVAIEPADGSLYAPVDGKVATILTRSMQSDLPSETELRY